MPLIIDTVRRYRPKILPGFTRQGRLATQRLGVPVVLIQMELARIIISEINDQQVIFLREVEGIREFPILIGLFEATSIDRCVQGEDPPRPLTHDLLKSAIESLGGEIQDVLIHKLEEHTYYASIRIQHEGELIEVDSRPSDAVALAVHFDPHLPIYVAEEVLTQASS